MTYEKASDETVALWAEDYCSSCQHSGICVYDDRQLAVCFEDYQENYPTEFKEIVDEVDSVSE